MILSKKTVDTIVLLSLSGSIHACDDSNEFIGLGVGKPYLELPNFRFQSRDLCEDGSRKILELSTQAQVQVKTIERKPAADDPSDTDVNVNAVVIS